MSVGMRWDDERYVRVYTRDTPGWCLLSWEARAIFLLLLRAVDRAGILHFGHAGSRAVAAVLRAPADVVQRALEELHADGCVQVKADWLVIPNFTAAQETPVSDAARKRDSRARAKARAMEDTPDVQDRPDLSRAVTPGHSDLICADPIRSDPDPLLARARVESLPESANPAEASPPPELTLGETFAAEAARPIGQLDALARELAAEGNPFGQRCVGYLDRMEALPRAMREKLREILDERAKPRPSGIRRISVTAEEQALVAVYVAAQKRIRHEDVPQLELHVVAARRILPDLETLAKSIARDGFAPTAADVLAHKLETYLKINTDQRLAAEGFPLGLVLARTDANDLPRPPRRKTPAGERDGPPLARGPERFERMGFGSLTAAREAAEERERGRSKAASEA